MTNESIFLTLSQRVEEEVAKISFDSEPKELYAPITYTLEGGGKRVRPLLTLLGYHLYHASESTPQEVLSAAMALEMFHNFTLLHDDIMDNSPIRRDRATVHVKWNSNAAILSGDTMLSYSYKLLSQVADKHFREVFNIFNRVAIQVYEGQQFDMMFEDRAQVEIAEYINMITLKTAVLLSGSITIGATLAGASKEDITRLDSFAINLGLAFQLQDDYLDTFATTESFGKQVGLDIECAKKTFLLITLLQSANEQDSIAIGDMLSSTSLTREQKLTVAKDMMIKYGVDTKIKQEIDSYINSALSDIDALSCGNDSKDMLKLLVNKMVNRAR